MSNWYARLKDYFPEREMKSQGHFEKLFKEKQENYKLMEGPDYIIVYLEESDFIFIDYILVLGGCRGTGVGSKALEEIKKKGKAIILEVEPVTLNDPDSEKRIRFYEKNGFLKMESIGYERIHMVTKELNKMDVFCWSPEYNNEQWVFERMQVIYEHVHTYKSRELYGCDAQPLSDVLWLRELAYNNLG